MIGKPKIALIIFQRGYLFFWFSNDFRIYLKMNFDIFFSFGNF